jgi:hypothetical protein
MVIIETGLRFIVALLVAGADGFEATPVPRRCANMNMPGPVHAAFAITA